MGKKFSRWREEHMQSPRGERLFDMVKITGEGGVARAE